MQNNAFIVNLCFNYIDIFVNCNWFVTRWQQYSTHLDTNNTQNNTKQIIHKITQKFWKGAGVLARFTLEFALKLRKRHGQQYKLYVTVYEGTYIPSNFQSLRSTYKRCFEKQNVRWLAAFLRHIIWLNKS
jgi:hypothetical protein